MGSSITEREGNCAVASEGGLQEVLRGQQWRSTYVAQTLSSRKNIRLRQDGLGTERKGLETLTSSANEEYLRSNATIS